MKLFRIFKDRKKYQCGNGHFFPKPGTVQVNGREHNACPKCGQTAVYKRTGA